MSYNTTYKSNATPVSTMLSSNRFSRLPDPLTDLFTLTYQKLMNETNEILKLRYEINEN